MNWHPLIVTVDCLVLAAVISFVYFLAEDAVKRRRKTRATSAAYRRQLEQWRAPAQEAPVAPVETSHGRHRTDAA